jgi:alkylation response protein AidB-like acyl-CoA dehydrogenase
VGAGIDAAELDLLAEAFRKTMTSASGQVLDLALGQLGWRDLLAELPGTAVPLAFRLLGETGAHAPLLNDVVLTASGRPPGGTVPLPYAGGSWVVWERTDQPSATVDGEIPLRRVTPFTDTPLADTPPTDAPLTDAPLTDAALTDAALAAGRRAVGWWLLGTGRAMLALARAHAVDREQFGRPIASFQAVRHRLADTLVALEGAEAVLRAADAEAGTGTGARTPARVSTEASIPAHANHDPELASLLAKAAAGQAALTAARHCQQVLGGIGFTAEHALHMHVKRALLLDGLLGSARELTREAGRRVLADCAAPRLVDL